LLLDFSVKPASFNRHPGLSIRTVLGDAFQLKCRCSSEATLSQHAARKLLRVIADTLSPERSSPIQVAHGLLSFGLDREPSLGTHLTTSRRCYTHHGIYVGQGRVVHYSGLSGFWHCGPVEEVPMFRFAGGRPVQIADRGGSLHSPPEIVRRARSRIGENDYRLLTNNCEHFCNWCVCGVSHSAQAERSWLLPLRALLTLFHS
jgi:Lecithin retinol acyltransferase